MSRIEFLLSFVFVICCATTFAARANFDLDVQNTCEVIKISLRQDGWKASSAVNAHQVKVCRIGEAKALIDPLALVRLDDIKVYYTYLTNKFYVSFKVQLTSSRILKEIAKREEFTKIDVSFKEVTGVRFVTVSQDFFKMRKDIKLYQKWTNIEMAGSGDKFAWMQFRTDSKEEADAFISSARGHKAVSLDVVFKDIVEMEVREKATESFNYQRKALTVLFDVSENVGATKMLDKTSLVQYQHNQYQSIYLFDFLDYNSNYYPVLVLNSDVFMPTQSPILPIQKWVLMQRRETPGVDFNKTWEEYKHGFGDWRNDFWLGLEKIHQLTKLKSYGLRMEFESHNGLQKSAQWNLFMIASEEENYQLNTESFDDSSTAKEDCFRLSNNRGFYTVDRDSTYQSCAKRTGGGWWSQVEGCAFAHFNSVLRSSKGSSRKCVHYGESFEGRTHFNECLKRVRMFLIQHN